MSFENNVFPFSKGLFAHVMSEVERRDNVCGTAGNYYLSAVLPVTISDAKFDNRTGVPTPAYVAFILYRLHPSFQITQILIIMIRIFSSPREKCISGLNGCLSNQIKGIYR